ncbi:DeoR family transcriptional regulator [Microvirga sp. W0021]|uniref:DeoR family transcriptional regulator n=1 Tax=Hohaiivirga grylli TaxID=3133970 RepID=A0ABV0BEQ1_9HYPH
MTLAEIVRRQGEMRVEDLAQVLGVSAVTIRSDLNYLEEQGLLIRSFGKALATNQLTPKFNREQATPNKAHTALMLRTVANLVQDDGPLLIGQGNLVKQIIPLLNCLHDLQLILCDIDAIALARQCLDGKINLLAGTLGADGSTLGGPKLIQSLKCELVDTYLCEAKAIDVKGNLIIDERSSSEFTQAALIHARQTITFIHSHNMAHTTFTESANLSIARIGTIAFSERPDIGCRELLTRLGFRLHPGPTGTFIFKQSQV